MLYVVAYSGPFAYLKPWTAVRDGKTNSQQFIIPSTLEGIRRKLGIAAILRHKLIHQGISWQQEMTHPRDWVVEGRGQQRSRPRAVLERGVLLSPELVLGLATAEDAASAVRQHVCLSRNEDLLLPTTPVQVLTPAEFDALPGFELRPVPAEADGAFLVGHNRYDANAPMYGHLTITGRPDIVPAFTTD